MHSLLEASEEIYSTTLQILNHYGVDAKAVPLVVAAAAQRLEQFAIGAMARELSINDNSAEKTRGADNEEVDDGGHITRD